MRAVLETVGRQSAGTAAALREAAARLREEAALLDREAGLLDLQESLARCAARIAPSVEDGP